MAPIRANESFFAVASQLADPACLREIRSDLPVDVFSGSEDPVGQQIEGVRDGVPIEWKIHQLPDARARTKPCSRR